MLTKEQKIKMIVDIKRGRISNKIIQFIDKMIVYVGPAKCTINDVQIAKNEFENTINCLKSLNIQIIEFVNVSKQFPDE